MCLEIRKEFLCLKDCSKNCFWENIGCPPNIRTTEGGTLTRSHPRGRGRMILSTMGNRAYARGASGGVVGPLKARPIGLLPLLRSGIHSFTPSSGPHLVPCTNTKTWRYSGKPIVKFPAVLPICIGTDESLA